LLVIPSGNSFAQGYYSLGDANGDGWCNWGDVNAMVGYFRGGSCGSWCEEGADANGSGQVTGQDVNYLVSFLNANGPAPIGACPCPVLTYDPNETAFCELTSVEDDDPATATFGVRILVDRLISTFHFSLSFDAAIVADFQAANVYPNGGFVYFSPVRPFGLTGDIIAVTFDCYGSDYQGLDFPEITQVFNLVLTAVPGAENTVAKVVENDPQYGPPAFYYGTTDETFSCASIFPSSPLQMAGDVNGNGQVNGIDVTYFVSYLKFGENKLVGRYFWNLPVDWNY
jgi:hypothetical protein